MTSPIGDGVKRAAALLLTTALGVGCAAAPGETVTARADVGSDHAAFAADMEDVRQALGIPGMAAGVIDGQQVVWAEGFGFADLEHEIAAAPDTPFGLASVTKPIAATLIMQLVEDGALDLDEPVAIYGVDVDNARNVTARHLLTHTSEGVPGTVHRYNGNRYGWLGGVIEGATGASFSDLLGERILGPVGMEDTALNPIDAWESTALDGLDDFRRSMGWGESFEHYPDVYRRLARPYQFRDDYEITSGMYHLVHNPAAGGISSVADLARFDIALDRGLLLGDEAMAEMLSPLVRTDPTRPGLNYGLGWYVQDLEGLRLIWHAGRWPPSTSALYVKVPDEDLSFVILANTDNLTVPFPGIGDGDLSKSLPALTFFRHFVFPRRHGRALPQIDWSADQAVLVDSLTSVADEEAHEFLERELWSFRQAYASSGQFAVADKLANVARLVFSGSSLSRDPAFTQTVGRMPVVEPVLSAARFAAISRLVLAWLVLVALALGWMIWRLIRSGAGVIESVTWLLGTILLGPVAVLAHLRVAGRPGATGWPVALSAALFSVTGYGFAWAMGIALLIGRGDDPNGLLILGATYLLPLLVGLLLVRAPLLVRSGLQPYRRAVGRGRVAEFITVSLAFAVMFSILLYVDNRVLSTIPSPTSPYFWAMISVVALLGTAALVPVCYAMGRRGFTIWPAIESGGGEPALPTLRDSWWMLFGALLLMVLVVGVAAGLYA